MPSTSSGIIIGSVASDSMKPPARRRWCARPMAPSVPITPAKPADSSARISEFLSASAISALPNSRVYQPVVKPCHAPMVRPALNE